MKDAGIKPWEELEIFTKNKFSEMGASLKDFKVLNKRVLQGIDGEYEVDAIVEFNFMGVDYLNLLECKCYKPGHAVDRDKVMVLNQKLQSNKAQKGILISTSSFQKAAIEFAKANNIALIQISEGNLNYIAKNYGARNEEDELYAFSLTINDDGIPSSSMVRKERGKEILIK